MGNSEIPQVGFFKKPGTEIEFEILALEKLFSRAWRLDPPLDHPHRVQFHNILYITGGEGIHHVDFKPCAFSPGSLIFIAQGQVHAFDIRREITGYLLLFTNGYLEKNLIHSDIISLYRLYNYHLHEPVIDPLDTGREEFYDILKKMSREYHYQDDFAKDEILRLLLKVLLLKAERVKGTVISREKNAEWLIRFSKFKELLATHHAETRSVKEYARMLGMSPKHLNTICKSVSGETGKQCIDKFIILETKRVLATADKTVQEISYDFGFDEPTNFVKYFKKHTGQSPAQFRKPFTI